MRNLYIIIIFTQLFVLIGCKEEKKDSVWHELPEVTLLDSLKNTEFAITLENPILDNKNIIYAPAFLFAWEAIKNELKAPFIFSEQSSNDFKLLNTSDSYKNSLKTDEYELNVNVEEGKISAYAFFNKTLPFPYTLEKLEEPIIFNNTQVRAFGMNYYDHSIDEFTDIIYYKNDDQFVLKFFPKNEHHEIILAKGLDSISTLLDAVKKTNTLIELGKEEQKKLDILWKYELTEDDIFSIPVIKFNIATKYNSIQNQQFQAGNKNYIVETAYQRTGFILNENGAVIESEAVAACLEAAEAALEIKHPKKMIFDKTFYIIIRRADQKNPYFVMKVENIELMSKK